MACIVRIWKTIVCASNRHSQLAHNFDELKKENDALKSRVDGLYATPASRVSGRTESDALGKRKCEVELDRFSVANDNPLWDEFALACSDY